MAIDPITQQQIDSFKSDGFLLPSVATGDSTGLPSSKVTSNNDSTFKRNIITWLVPEFGTVKMYVNPEQIIFSDKKSITSNRTKGGFTLQYWGEELTTLAITGTTGRSGIEGINVLQEIYRAEQYSFDTVALSMAANNATANIVNNGVNQVGGAINSLFGGSSNSPAAAAVGIGLGGILGLSSANNNLAQREIKSLAELAFTVEMYYNNAVYRGYFTNMSVTESANNFLFTYSIGFTVTQKRGYRVNYLPFHVSATNGPSSYNTPNSFSGIVK